MLKCLVEKLIERQNLSSAETKLAVQEIVDASNPCQSSAFLALIRAKGETAEEICGMIQGMREMMLKVPFATPVLDIVGTGGDGAQTVNISTASCILAASCGVKIAKHGNRSVSSLCGSADVLEALGIDLDLSPDLVQKSVQDINIGFMFAPLYHPAMKSVKPIRSALKIRTVFNIIGPLLNPAEAQHLMVGVFHPGLLELVAHVIQKLGTKRSFVFHGNGLDELTCLGTTEILEVTPNHIRRFKIDPLDYGLPLCKIEDLKGAAPLENARLITEALQGKNPSLGNTLVLNAGVAVYLYGLTSNLSDAIHLAQDRLDTGCAHRLLQQWIRQCTVT